MSNEASIKLNYVLSEDCVLSERETECLSLVAVGYSNLHGANVLNISKGMFKLYVGDRSYAVVKAIRFGILTYDMVDRVLLKYNLQPRDVQRSS